MVDRRARISIGVFLALLALPLVQLRVRLLPPAPLVGFEKPVQRVPLTAKSWWTGRFQEAFEPWFARRFPVREQLVRTDNQVSLTIFGQAPSGGTPLVLGRGGTIIEKAYLDEYNRPRTPSAARIAAMAQDLRRLDELLARRGVPLIVVIAPSKAEIYREALPPWFVLPGRERRRSTYELLAPQLEAAGIALVDGHRIFLEERSRSALLLFARGGTHWNHYGGALIAERLLAALDRRAPGRFVQLKVTGARTGSDVWSTDDDLGTLLNIWWPRPWPGPQTHPVVERLTEGRAPARLLFVGDSFTLTCMEYLTGEGLMAPGDSIYYFNRRIRYPGGAATPLERQGFDVLGEIEEQDAVVLVMSEYFLNDLGFGFVAAALASLESAPAPPPGDRTPGR